MARLEEIAKGPGWLTDPEAAKSRAAVQGKDLFIYSAARTGVLGAVCSRRLSSIGRPLRYAARNFVLVELDDPHHSAQPPNSAIRQALDASGS